jgi:acetolactate synthase regulatory subunit
MCYELTKLVQDNQFSDITETMQRSLGFVSRWGFKAVTVACENAEVDSPHSLYLYLSSKREKANENQ